MTEPALEGGNWLPSFTSKNWLFVPARSRPTITNLERTVMWVRWLEEAAIACKVKKKRKLGNASYMNRYSAKVKPTSQAQCRAWEEKLQYNLQYHLMYMTPFEKQMCVLFNVTHPFTGMWIVRTVYALTGLPASSQSDAQDHTHCVNIHEVLLFFFLPQGSLW